MSRDKVMLKKYRIETRGERAERLLLPLVCRVVGHKPQGKFKCIICRRCSIVLEER